MRIPAKLIKGKIVLSGAETAREFGQWYLNRWKKDYPDLYENRWSTKMPYTSRRRGRRLTAKRAIVVSPARSPKRRRQTTQHSKGGSSKARFSTTNIGVRVGEGTTKKVLSHQNEALELDTQDLRFWDLTAIGKGDGINERTRQIINLRGFKMQAWFQNRSSLPLVVNWAIAAGNQKNVISSTDFLRGYGSSRWVGISAGSGLDRALGDINIDEYVVLKHKRFSLAEATVNTEGNAVPFNTDAKISSWKMKEFYIPIKRQLRYSTEAAISCLDKVFFVVWVDYPGDATTAGPREKVLKLDFNSVIYFKEPKND